MEEHYCEYVLEWELCDECDDAGKICRFSRPLEICGKVARFQVGLGAWYCAQHYDQHIESVELLNKHWEEYDKGICKDCNCEISDGKCNCQFYNYG